MLTRLLTRMLTRMLIADANSDDVSDADSALWRPCIRASAPALHVCRAGSAAPQLASSSPGLPVSDPPSQGLGI